jgi:hypothetical protein
MHIVSNNKASIAAVIYKSCIINVPKAVYTQQIYSNNIVLESREYRYLVITSPEIQGRPGQREREKKKSDEDDFIYHRLVLEKIIKHEAVVCYCSSKFFKKFYEK